MFGGLGKQGGSIGGKMQVVGVFVVRVVVVVGRKVVDEAMFGCIVSTVVVKEGTVVGCVGGVVVRGSVGGCVVGGKAVVVTFNSMSGATGDMTDICFFLPLMHD